MLFHFLKELNPHIVYDLPQRLRRLFWVILLYLTSPYHSLWKNKLHWPSGMPQAV